MTTTKGDKAELERLDEDAQRKRNWKRFGPYLSERQWGTVREDYSHDGSAWDYFPHEHARARAYRWGEDGLLGICDRQGRMCFAVALWNGRDPILKERLFGVTGPEGNHGEAVKECYYYLDSSPTHSFLRGLYKYPQAEYPYEALVAESRRRTRQDHEYSLIDSGVLDDGRYFDVLVEYAKGSPDDILVRIHATNRGAERAELHVLPTLWFRNTWSWGCEQEGCAVRPRIQAKGSREMLALEPTLGNYVVSIDTPGEGLFTENETNVQRLYGGTNAQPYVKDAFHEHVVNGHASAVNPKHVGSKAAWRVKLDLAAGETRVIQVRITLQHEHSGQPFGRDFGHVFAAREREYEAWLGRHLAPGASVEERRVQRQAYAGLLWSKQFYHYVVDAWLQGDADQPAPPAERKRGRNRDWKHLYNRDVISMPDKWEYPWYAAWDLAFHALPLARIDPYFAKQQLELFLREWYMHPSGQIPAYEWALGDVNPPVHAWAVWRVYKVAAARGGRDRRFLASCFQKLLLNFTWWVNRKDANGNHIFAGGFLGLDNIGVFDRSKPLPGGATLEQADGTAWMAFYCGTMLSMALELAKEDPGYEDMASKFFEHFIAICDAMNALGGTGLWNEKDGFYYDQMVLADRTVPLEIRSMVGLIPLVAVEILESDVIERMPGFKKRMEWFLTYRKDLARHVSYLDAQDRHRLLAIPSRERLERVLGVLLDENEFLAPHGLRSVSRAHATTPYVLRVDGQEHRVDYAPGESTTAIFGGNSNWRGPIWFPVNYLLVEALERYHHFYGDTLRVEFPKGSGQHVTLDVVAAEISARLVKLFLPDANGHRPCHGGDERYASDPHWKDLILFHEHFHGDNGRGLGASHQTGWTALVATLVSKAASRTNSAGGLGPRSA